MYIVYNKTKIIEDSANLCQMHFCRLQGISIAAKKRFVNKAEISRYQHFVDIFSFTV